MSSSLSPIPVFFGFNLGPTELIIILLIVLLLFGGSKLPALAKGLGQSIKEFKKAAKEDSAETPAAPETKKEEPAASANGKPHGSN